MNAEILHKELSFLTVEHPMERRLFSMLAITLAVLTVGYLYCVASSVLNVIARKEAVARATALESTIGGLEQEYLALSQEVTPASGTSLGLVPVAHTAYVRRPSTVGVANVASDEI